MVADFNQKPQKACPWLISRVLSPRHISRRRFIHANTSSEPLLAALLFFVASKIFDGPSLSQCYSRSWWLLVLSRLDYGSTVLFGLPQQLVDKLQSVQNAAARLIFAACRRDHTSPLMQSLHWLRVADRIIFRLAVAAVLTYRCLHSSAP